MSEPVTNAEIEDVLSAVRRLVSESGAPRREERRREPVGKLVLTPAFRVDTVADPVATDKADPADVTDAQGNETAEADTSQPAEKPMASVESLVQRAVSATPEPVDQDTDEDWDEPEVALSSDESQPVEDDVPEAGFVEVNDEDELVSSLEDRIAELESVVTDSTTQEWEPDGSEEQDAPATVIFRHAGAAAGPRFDEPDHAESVDEEPEVDLPDPDPMGVAEAAEIDVQEWEDVVDTPTAYAVPDIDEDEDDYDAPYAAEPEQVMGDYEIGENTADDMVIDEDMLREIVGRLVREELQGTMGERITRNLRRMVRREIARAIALKDFD